MKYAIKIGDLLLVYETPVEKPQGFWYELGKELGIGVLNTCSYLKRAHKKSGHIPLKSSKISIVDYSCYEIPTVYRKWR